MAFKPSPSIFPAKKLTLKVQSEDFAANGEIPNEFTGFGKNKTPQLSWQAGPPKTQTFAILVEDPDAPRDMAYVHWTAVNIPAHVTEVQSGVLAEPAPPELVGGINGFNDRGGLGYSGPKPKAGPAVHHYHFRILALDQQFDLPTGYKLDKLPEMLKGHVLAEGDLVGTVKRVDDSPSLLGQ